MLCCVFICLCAGFVCVTLDVFFFFVFFFKQKTAYEMRISDWSSDVCSSDLVRAAMREVRVALLEADVALPVARDFVDQVTEKAIGHNVLRSVTPGQQVVKIVSDALTEMLGSDQSDLLLDVTPPAVEIGRAHG